MVSCSGIKIIHVHYMCTEAQNGFATHVLPKARTYCMTCCIIYRGREINYLDFTTYVCILLACWLREEIEKRELQIYSKDCLVT